VPALVHGQKGDPFIETPLTDAAHNEKRRLLTAEFLGDKPISVQADVKMFGQRALETRMEIADCSKEELFKHLTTYESRGMTAVKIDESTMSATDERKSTNVFSLKYGFEATETVSRTEKRLLVRPALLAHPDESLSPLPRRQTSLYFHYPWSETDR